MKSLSPSKSSPSFIPSDGSAAMGLLDSLQRSVRHLQASGRYGTARNYHAALRSLTVFLSGPRPPDWRGDRSLCVTLCRLDAVPRSDS